MREGAQTAPGEVFEALATRKLLIVSGKGGVGRTTVAALLGATLARKGRRILVATIGHDDRLAWMLGAPRLREHFVEVAPGLVILRLEPAACLREYGSLVLRSRRLSSAVFGNRLVRKLFDAIPGADDFAVLGKVWHEATRAGRFDLVIFDGPATGHLRLALGVPRAIVDAVADGPLAREAAEVKASLEDPSVTGAVLVTVPERWPLTEIVELSRGLREDIGLGVAAMVVNKRWSARVPPLDPSRVGDLELREAVRVVDASNHRGRRQQEVLREWLAKVDDDPAVARMLSEGLVELPWRAGGVESLADLEDLLALAQPRSHAPIERA